MVSYQFRKLGQQRAYVITKLIAELSILLPLFALKVSFGVVK